MTNDPINWHQVLARVSGRLVRAGSNGYRRRSFLESSTFRSPMARAAGSSVSCTTLDGGRE
jgi:hypothetical protein